MKRRGFLGLLGLAPAVPLIAKEALRVRPATANEQVAQIKNVLRETFPKLEPPCWQLQPLDENQQPWMGEWPQEADCSPVLIDGTGTGETDLSITLPMTTAWIGKYDASARGPVAADPIAIPACRGRAGTGSGSEPGIAGNAAENACSGSRGEAGEALDYAHGESPTRTG